MKMDQLIKIRRELHQIPEIGYNLQETYNYLFNKLQEYGYTPHPIGNHGLYTYIGEGETSLMIRSDMDALEMKEESGLPFASNRDYAHTCGHDIHMTLLLGIANYYRSHPIPGRIKLVFQPSEEDASGAHHLINEGVLEDVEAVLGCHVVANEESKTLSYNKGILMSSCDFFTITIKGSSSHGSEPHKGIDPIMIASHLLINLEMLHSRMIDAKERFTLTMGQITSGSTYNIIPDSCTIKGTLRTFNPEIRKQLLNEFNNIIKYTGEMYHAEISIEFPTIAYNVNNDETLYNLFNPILEKNFKVNNHKEPLSISEDFSYYGLTKPSFFFLLGARKEESFSLHDSHIIFDEEAIETGVKAYISMIEGYYEENNK